MLGCRRKHQYPGSVSGQLLKGSATSRTALLIVHFQRPLVEFCHQVLWTPPRIPPRDGVGMFLNLPGDLKKIFFLP